MAKATKAILVGDTVMSPSGAFVRVTAAVDAKRRWGVIGVASVWQVRRHQPDQSGSGWQYLLGGKPVPLQLGEDDAKALVDTLNRVLPATRYRVALASRRRRPVIPGGLEVPISQWPLGRHGLAARAPGSIGPPKRRRRANS